MVMIICLSSTNSIRNLFTQTDYDEICKTVNYTSNLNKYFGNYASSLTGEIFNSSIWDTNADSAVNTFITNSNS
jgi:hypothetical protein